MRDLFEEIGGAGLSVNAKPGGRDLLAELGMVRQEPAATVEAPTEAKPNYWRDQLGPTLAETGKQIFEIPKSLAEVGATTATGTLGWLVGSGLGIAEALRPGSTRESVMAAAEDAAGRLTYQPRTQPAAVLMEKAGRGIEAITGPAKEIAALPGESWNSPFLESVLKFAGEAATFEAIGAAGRVRPKTPEWYRRLTIPERGLVEGMKVDIASGNLTPEQIRQLWKDPANRAELLKRYQGVNAGTAEAPAGNIQSPGQRPMRTPGTASAELPPGGQFELRPRPGEVRDILAELGKEGPRALPFGQGFDLQGEPYSPTERALMEGAPSAALALPYPEGVGEGFTSRPGMVERPIVTKSGGPFRTEATATQAGKDLDWGIYEVVKQGDGYAIARKQGREFRPENEPPKPKLNAVDEIRAEMAALEAAQKSPEIQPPSDKPVVMAGSPFRLEAGAIQAMERLGMSPAEYRPAETPSGWVVKKIAAGTPETPAAPAPAELVTPEPALKEAPAPSEATLTPAPVPVLETPAPVLQQAAEQPRETRSLIDAPFTRKQIGGTISKLKYELKQRNKAGQYMNSAALDMLYDRLKGKISDLRKAGELDEKTVSKISKSGVYDEKYMAEVLPEAAQEIAPEPTRDVAPIKSSPRKPKKGPEGIIGRILELGGINAYGSYNVPELRQFPDMARVLRKDGKGPDVLADILKDEGFVSPDGKEWSGDNLIEWIKAGKARKIYTPEKQDAIIEREVTKAYEEWERAQQEAYEEDPFADRGETQEDIERIAKEEALDEIAGSESLTEEELAALSDEAGNFFDEIAAAREEKALEKKPTVEDYKGKKETGELEGMSFEDTFSLTNTETEIGRGLVTHEKGQQTAGMFEEEPSKKSEEKPPEAQKSRSFIKGDVSTGVNSRVVVIDKPPGPIGSERGSTGPVNESEILQSILKARGKIAEAMPHLEALGRSVYEGGKTRFLDWQAAIKTRLGELWNSFKAYMKGIFDRLQSGELGPLKNQKGAVGYDIKDKGPIIKQREIKDAKTGEIRMAPPVYRSEFEAVVKMPELREKPLGGWLENPIRTFEELGPQIKELFYRPVKEAEHLAKKHFQQIHEKAEKIRKALPGASSERIGIYAIAQQKGGAEILAAMKITRIPELTPAEMKAYEWMRSGLETFYGKLQEARARAGKEGFGHVENYFTFARQFSILEKLGFSPIFTRGELLNTVMHKKTTPFQYEKHRVGGLTRADLDAFGVFNRYMESATRHYYLSPAISKGREMLLTFHPTPDTKWILRDEKPGAAKFITEWLDYQAGQRKPQLPRLIEKALTKLNKNLAFAVLSANIRSALIQPTALVNTVTEIGPKWTYEGIKGMLDRSAIEKSNVLLSRQFDVNVSESLSGIPGRIGKARQTVGNALMQPLQWLDMQTARATWNGAHRKAISEKMSERDAINYADDVVTRTQGSAMPSDLSPVQRTALGKSLTMFQTFVINQWGFLTRDVLGIKNKAIKTPDMIKRVATFMLATTLVNSFYEDVLGIPSPLPSPVGAFLKALEKGDSFPSASAQAAAEVATLVPIVGGGLRYGSSMLGAPAEFIGDIGKKLAPNYVGPTRSTAELVAKGTGIPGTSQTVKTVKILNQGGSLVDAMLGRYQEKSKSRLRSSTLRTGLKTGLKSSLN